MRKFFLIIVIFQMLPVSLIMGQEAYSDTLLFEERAYYYHKYRSVRDTMTINTWLNLKRVSDNLEQVVNRDQQVIDALKAKIASDSALIANLNDINHQNERLLAQKEIMTHIEKNEKLSIVYLKAVVGFLLFLMLVLIYFLVNRYKRYKNFRNSSDHYESIAEDRQHLIEQTEMELRKMKQRELDFRDELERGIQSNQERMLSIQEKCDQLEIENQQLRAQKESDAVNHTSSLTNESNSSGLPENIEELKLMIKSLEEERSSLMNLAGKLKSQLLEESTRNREIIKGINLLIKDMPENTVD